MASLYLLVLIDGERVALSATQIDSVVMFAAMTPVPHAAAHVMGLAALRSQVVTVIDVRAAIGLPAMRERRAIPTVIVVLDGQCYGLAIDAVEDVVTAGPPSSHHALPGGRWDHAASGLIEHDGSLLLVIEPAALIAPRLPVAA